MFNNIGKKIKSLAKVICYLGIIASCISGIVVMVIMMEADDEIGAIIGFVALVVIAGVGSLSAWIGSFFMYGFGELVDKTTDTAKNTEVIASKINAINTNIKLNSNDANVQKLISTLEETKLQQLREMYANGEITEEEYIKSKNELLSQI